MEKIWIVTRCENQFDQYGDYFVSAFDHKPTVDEIRTLLGRTFSIEYAEYLLTGGGRRGHENTWYYLTEIKSGEEYKHRN